MTYEINIPSGLPEAVLSVLDFHRGRSHAIGREGLVLSIAKLGWNAHERLVRECIKYLRRRGQLICSTPGTDGGYYIANSLKEFDDFDQAEFGAKIADMNETRLAMKRAAREQYGDAVQMEMAI